MTSKGADMRPQVWNRTSIKTSKGLDMRPQVWNRTSVKTQRDLIMRPQVWNMASTKTSKALDRRRWLGNKSSTKTSKGLDMRPQVWNMTSKGAASSCETSSVIDIQERIGRNKISIKMWSLFLNQPLLSGKVVTLVVLLFFNSFTVPTTYPSS